MSKPNRASFADIQRFIAEQLRSVRRLDRVEEATAGATAILTGNDRLSPVEQLEIYRQQFWLRHTSSLVEDFPGLSGILGQAEWEKLAESYLTQVPPTSWTLRDLGDRLPAHVEARPQTPHHALCVDMARLEWLYIELFDAEECPPLDGAKLATIADEQWPRAIMVMNPALRFLRTRYPVAGLRRRLRRAQAGEDVDTSIPDPTPQNLVLYRDADRGMRYTVVQDAPMTLLEALSAGTALGPACEHAAQHVPGAASEIETKVATWFADWGRRGWIVDVDVPR